jgi:hypothetical protein
VVSKKCKSLSKKSQDQIVLELCYVDQEAVMLQKRGTQVHERRL